jgi:hypothetical protein
VHFVAIPIQKKAGLDGFEMKIKTKFRVGGCFFYLDMDQIGNCILV